MHAAHVALECNSADVPHLPVGLKNVEGPEGGHLGEVLLGHGLGTPSRTFIMPHGRHQHVLSQLVPIDVVASAIDEVRERLVRLYELELIGE